MAEGLRDGPVSVGDLTLHLDDILDGDEALSRALVPEVWLVARREGGGGRHEQERRKFLRIQVLREVTLSARQSIGLEPWGRMKVEYEGLDSALPWIQSHAHGLGMPADDLREGVASVLDYLRRKRVLHDPEREIFTKYWMDGDLEVQQGYLPQLGNPTGTKLQQSRCRESRTGHAMAQRARRNHDPSDRPEVGCPVRRHGGVPRRPVQDAGRGETAEASDG